MFAVLYGPLHKQSYGNPVNYNSNNDLKHNNLLLYYFVCVLTSLKAPMKTLHTDIAKSNKKSSATIIPPTMSNPFMTLFLLVHGANINHACAKLLRNVKNV